MLAAFDTVIKNGTVVIPEKDEIVKANVGISGGKIAAVTPEKLEGKNEIDAENHIVCPGFIDVHGHLDGNDKGGEASALQGITTSVGGNCGFGPLDIQSFFDNQERRGFIINQAELIGQSFPVRNAAGVKNEYGGATKSQIEKMSEIVEKALLDGAAGLSFGLEYAPGYTWDEIVKMAETAAKYGKIVAVHTNLSGPYDTEHLSEIVELSKKTGAHLHISHFVYQYGMGVMTKALRIVDKALDEGVEISADSGMYTRFATFMGSRVYDEEHLEKFGWKYGDLLVTTGIYAGKRLDRRLYLEMREKYPDETCICFTGVEEEIYEALDKPYMMMSTDSGKSPESHPQAIGSYPRFFRKLVREKNRLSLLEAVKRCTLLPAKTFSLNSKGRLSPGCDADITVFDIDTVKDRADFYGLGDPTAKPLGIDYVIVNGTVVAGHGKLVENARPGKAIKFL